MSVSRDALSPQKHEKLPKLFKTTMSVERSFRNSSPALLSPTTKSLKSPSSKQIDFIKSAIKSINPNIDVEKLQDELKDDLIEIDNIKIEDFKSKLPSLTELINMKVKNIDKTLHQSLIELIKYGQSLENIIKHKNKEIHRLEYLNRYLVVAQQKRDEMLAHTLEENRKLKELTLIYERMMNGNLHSRNKKPKSNTVSNLMAAPNTIPGLPGAKLSLRKKAVDQQTLPSEGKNTNIKFFSKKIMGKLAEEKKSQNILNLNMNKTDMTNLLKENESVIFLKALLEEEDGFIQTISNLEYSSLITLYDSIHNVLDDLRSLYDIIYRLKKLIKAANSMTESMILGEAIEKIVDETCECLECDRATVFMLDQQKEELWSKVAKGSSKTIRIPWNKGIVGQVAEKGEPLTITNAYSDERFNKEIDRQMNYKTNTILCVPIMNKNLQVIGVVQAINKLNGFFTKDDEGLLSILANLAGVVLRNSIQFDEQLLFHNGLRHVLRTGIYLSSFITLDHLLPNAEKRLKDVMNVEQAEIFVHNQKENLLLRYLEGGEIETFPMNCGIAGHVMLTEEIVNVANAYNSHYFNGIIDIKTSMPLLSLPIKTLTSEKIGVFEVINPKGVNVTNKANHVPIISPLMLETLEFFSQQLAQTILKCFDYKNLIDKHNQILNLEGE